MVSRKVIIVLAALAAVAVVAGVLFQYSTAQTLAFAEALQFRRLLVAAQDDGTYRFFFATNRGETEAEADPENGFTSERSPGIRFGFFDTDIEPSLGIGMLINPSDWFQNEEIQVRAVTSVSADLFVEELRAQVDASPRRALLINVNGFRERFPSALRKTAFLAHVLDMNLPVLVFDWPGDQGATPRRYLRAQRLARESGAELAELIRLVTREVRPDHLGLMANSMGAEVVVSAFAELFADPDFSDLDTELAHVVLTAPDFSHADFSDRFQAQIQALADRLTVYVSSNDRALLMSRIINRERRLGESTVDPATLDPLNPDQFEEAAALYDAQRPDGDRVVLVDITPVNRTRNFHNFSLETPEYFDDVYLRLSNETTPNGRPLYRVRQQDGREYWVLTGGR